MKMKHFLKSLMGILLAALMLFLAPAGFLDTFADDSSGDARLPEDKIYGTFYFAQGGDSPASFVYSDAYFNDPSTEYDTSLSVLLLSVAMSAYNARSGGKSDYSKKYSNLEGIMTQMGYSNFEHNEYYEIKPQTDSMGVGIASKFVTLSDGTIQPIIGIACRGGNYESEWVGNVSIGGSGDAAGFGKARDIVIEFLNSYLDEHIGDFLETGVRSPKIWVCGYSRGSATATLTGNYIDCAILHEGPASGQMSRLSGYLDAMNVQFEDVFVYGFEVPQGLNSDSEYQASNTGNIWCIVDPSDPVPYVAPSAFGFSRPGTDVDPTEGVSWNDFVEQLQALDPGMAKDWQNEEMRKGFVAREYDLYGLFHAWADEDKSFAASWSRVGDTFAEFEYNLFNKWLVPNLVRTADGLAEAEGLSAREIYAEFFQEPIAIITAVLMGASDKDAQTFTNAVKDAISDNLTTWRYMCLVSAASNAFEGTATSGSLIGALLPLVNNVLDDLMNNENVTAIVSKSDLALIKSRAYYLTCFLSELILSDFSNGFQYIATAVHYMDEWFAPHNCEYILAYLRAQDGYTDRNRYSVTVTAPEGYSLENVQLCLYRRETVSPYDKVLVATISAEGLSVVPGEEYYFNGTGTYSDTKIQLCSEDRNWSYYTQWFEVSCIEDAGAADKVIIEYDYLNNGTHHKGVRQDFENVQIPIVYGDVLQLRPASDQVQADLTKYIQLTPVFVDEDYEPITAGSITVTSNGTEQDLSEISATAENKLNVTAPDGYLFLQAELPVRDVNREIVKDTERETIYTKTVNNLTTWDLDMLSDTLYLVCREKMHDGYVYAEAIYQHLKTQNGKTLINDEENDVVLTIENLTRDSSSSGSGSIYLEAEPGDKIKITASFHL